MEPINERLLRIGKQIVKIADDEHLPAAEFIYLLGYLHRSAIDAVLIDPGENIDDEPVGSC